MNTSLNLCKSNGENHLHWYLHWSSPKESQTREDFPGKKLGRNLNYFFTTFSFRLRRNFLPRTCGLYQKKKSIFKNWCLEHGRLSLGIIGQEGPEKDPRYSCWHSCWLSTMTRWYNWRHHTFWRQDKTFPLLAVSIVPEGIRKTPRKEIISLVSPGTWLLARTQDFTTWSLLCNGGMTVTGVAIFWVDMRTALQNSCLVL